MKLRRSPVWLAFILLPLIPAFMGTVNYLQNIAILQDRWYSLWTQHTLFTCYFFLPAIIGVYCSYLMRLEHSSHNWNATLSMPVPVAGIYFAKLLNVSLMILLTQAWIGVLFVLSGKIAGIVGPLPVELLSWLMYGTLGGIVIAALQLFISLVIRSFAVPVGLALCGGIAGLPAIAKGFGVWFPYALMSLGMFANNAGDEMAFTTQQFIINSGLYILVFSLLAILWLKYRDAPTG